MPEKKNLYRYYKKQEYKYKGLISTILSIIILKKVLK